MSNLAEIKSAREIGLEEKRRKNWGKRSEETWWRTRKNKGGKRGETVHSNWKSWSWNLSEANWLRPYESGDSHNFPSCQCLMKQLTVLILSYFHTSHQCRVGQNYVGCKFSFAITRWSLWYIPWISLCKMAFLKCFKCQAEGYRVRFENNLIGWTELSACEK